MVMNESCFESLKGLYIRCCKEINVEPGLFLKKTISSTKNKIHNAVLKSKYETGPHDPLAVALFEEGYIRKINNCDDQYTITAKGMWAVEKKYYEKNENDIINELDDRFFCSELEKMTEKNKIILLAIIAVHGFSEKNGINYVDAGAEKAFLNLMRDSFEILHELKRVDIQSFDSLLSANNNQKKNTAVLTSTIDTLPRSTYSLFVSKKNCYYVDLVKDKKIDKVGLKNLLKLILGDLEVSEIEVIMNGCKDMSLKYSCYFHKDDSICDSEYDDAIELSLTELAGM